MDTWQGENKAFVTMDDDSVQGKYMVQFSLYIPHISKNKQ
jgi:hypothetical protein